MIEFGDPHQWCAHGHVGIRRSTFRKMVQICVPALFDHDDHWRSVYSLCDLVRVLINRAKP